MAEALAFLHDSGVLHRDIKPGNVMLEKSGHARLMDFGLVRPLDETRLTRHDMMLGTLAFLPPEVVTGKESSAASDVYQVGLVLHLALTGEHLFDLTQGLEAFVKALTARDRRVEIRRADVPADLAAIIEACCRTDPAERPTDGQALVELAASTIDWPDEARGAVSDEWRSFLEASAEASAEGGARRRPRQFFWLGKTIFVLLSDGTIVGLDLP